MPAKKTSEVELQEALLRVFREHGFEGASLSLIAQETGLGRASLYHRFPGGKQEMAMTVFQGVHERFRDDVLAPLSESGTPATRVRKIAKRIDEFYEQGYRACLLDTLSLGQPDTPLREAMAESMQAILNGLSQISREAGLSPAQAKRRAQEALVDIEGSLVVSRVSGDNQPFQQVLRHLPELLTGPA